MEGKKETAQTDIDAGSCTVDRTILYVRLPRELDHHNAEAVRRQADRMLERFMILRLVFDFQDTEFMDSSGIGVIMGRDRKCRGNRCGWNSRAGQKTKNLPAWWWRHLC